MRRNFSPVALAAVSLVCLLILTACNSGGSPKLRYITVTPSSATINAGSTQQFMATGFFSDGTSTPNFAVVWLSSSTAVATIDGTLGVATGVGGGTTNITATASGVTSAPATLTVAGLQSIALTPANTTISPNATQQYTATGTFKNADGSTSTADVTSQITTWNSGTPAVATISNSGLATGVGGGTTLITATSTSFPGITGQTNLTVSGVPVPVSLVVSPAAPTIAVGNADTFTAQEKYSDGSLHPLANPSTLTWASDTATTATIFSATGIAAAHGAGTATITATEGALTGNTLLTVVTGSTHYAYVSIVNDSVAQWYSVNATNASPFTSQGTFSPAGASPFQTVIHPNGKYMYIIDQANSIFLYTIDPTTGTPTLVPGTLGNQAQVTLAASTANYGTVDAYGQLLYVTDSDNSTVYAFQISQTDGTLIAVLNSPFTTNISGPQIALVDPTSSYVYVVDQGTDKVSAYTINQTAGTSFGALVPNATTPTVPTGNTPDFAAIDPSGTHLYVANSGDNTVSGYTIGTGGTLTAFASALSVSGATSVLNVAVDPSGKYLYVLDTGDDVTINGQVYGYTIGGGGVPSTTPITGTPQATGLGPVGIAIDPTTSLLAAENNFASPGSISYFKITTATGALSAGTLVPAGNQADAGGSAPIYITFYNAAP